eukprot:COSAG01_NODE_30_length_36127_cov_41.433234_16_plen_157_part_00
MRMHAALYYLSLVGGFSAPLITKVLRATAYLTAPPRQVSGACSPCTRLVSTELYRCNTLFLSDKNSCVAQEISVNTRRRLSCAGHAEARRHGRDDHSLHVGRRGGAAPGWGGLAGCPAGDATTAATAAAAAAAAAAAEMWCMRVVVGVVRRRRRLS